MSAGISIFSILTFTLLSKWLSRYSFLLLHVTLLTGSAFCLYSGQEDYITKISFLSMVGFGLMIYFSNWSLASVFINPFESKRIFQFLGCLHRQE